MNRTTHFPPFDPTTSTLARECAQRWGSATFVVSGDQRLSYAEAEAQSACLAKALLVSGVGKGTHVGLLAPNCPEWIVGWLAISRIGAVAVLLNTYNKAPELRRILRHSDLAVLLTVGRHLGHDYLDRLEQTAPDLAAQTNERLLLPSHPYLRSIWVWDAEPRAWCGALDDLVARADDVSDELLVEVEAEVHPADPMVMVYSSGSTAEPKAAVHTHGAVVRHAHNLGQMRDLRSDDVLYTPMPMFWVGGFSFTLVGAMHAGATLVFEEQFEPGATLELIERERVTQVLGWPHMAKALVDHPSFAERDLSSIRAGSMAALLPQHLQADADVPKANSLGMTETLGPHTFDTRDELPPEKVGSFGRSVPGVEHLIVDPVTGAVLPTGEVGELWLRGYSVMVGLHKRERTETFTADGWYRTGDAGWFDADGHFYFTGRMGDLIKTSGMNVTPREVEEVLESMDEVVMAFVTGIDHPDRGQDVVAAIALRPGERLEEDEARARAKEELASYKVPRRIAVFADQTELPWLDSGKVDRRALTALLGQRFGAPSEQP
ncbi:MAG: acyl--CoA ligase [Acidobacteria bacterium]|nr:acyl--CoA ligase [Acidobacteriota bacterium]